MQRDHGDDGRVDVALDRRRPVVENEHLADEERHDRREDDQQTVEQDDEEGVGLGGVVVVRLLCVRFVGGRRKFRFICVLHQFHDEERV